MDSIQIRIRFSQLCPDLTNIFCADRNYAEVKKDYLLKNFYNWYKGFLFNQDVVRWDTRFDCDDFARSYSTLIQLAHFQAKGNNDEGVAVGEIFFHINGDPTKGHAINCAFTEEGLIFIEPQNGTQLHLSNEEVNSIFFARF
jgi:hypothetical protein